MTLLDACIQVLDSAKAPLPADEIFNQINSRNLYDFKAKDPKSIVRATLRKHVKNVGKHQVVQVSPGLFKKA